MVVANVVDGGLRFGEGEKGDAATRRSFCEGE